ncbi:Biopolymer transport protein ExbD/TolR [Desulfarculus baarsii DSM 2075]|uniref:Biopolymer transport protein ExbD/TolR n=1 Tax=Desulfarculus baarsii (strain ATCC 33931 / DSM 2075 / LMG 7858 / VKM B-1802 / 2st14) TaxID=644282 RepID=E1QJB3_DESB2|nr:biopolymer transporter ExbD [Desulfarculus baarsii]ADK85656.1 Biopolymer transport protein ExbD/TolR [Desulfarculus baarsii DSM 2075]
MISLRGRLGRFGSESINEEAQIDMAPLIDMVFILLIFFLVTTSFVREAGVDVQRPTASTATTREKAAMMVAVDKQGRIFIDRRQVDVRSVRGLVERYLAEDPGGGVVIIADRDSNTGGVIEVLDQCRLAGAKNVSVAANRRSD